MEQKLRRDRNIGSNLKSHQEKHNISQENFVRYYKTGDAILAVQLMQNMKMAN